MKYIPSVRLTAVLLLLLAPGLRAQEKPVAVRPLGPIIATSRISLRSIIQIRPLSDGRVLANDALGRQLVLFDSSLATITTVADTTSGTRRQYGAAGAGLLPFYGDSSLFADNASLAMLIVDPDGRVNRVIAAPRGDLGGLGYTFLTAYGATFDGLGRVMSKWPPRGPGRSADASMASMAGAASSATASGFQPAPDTQPIVRIELTTKRADTVAWLKAAVNTFTSLATPSGTGDGGHVIVQVRNPLPTSDDWTVLADGTVAVVRELSYRVDWIAPDGKRALSPPIPHEWVRFTDSMKAAFMDSVKSADSIARAATATQRDSLAKAAAMRGVTLLAALPPRYVDPSALPDYFPPILGVGNVKADADGNIWIRTYQTKTIAGGSVYDIVNRQGQLVDRVQIPGGTTLMGFGPGVVYLTSHEAQGVALARARIR